MNISTWRYPLSDIAYDHEEAQAVARVLESGWLTMGREVEAFETEFAQAHGAKYAVMVSSGTAALELALDAVGLEPGEEVIVPAITFAATANAVLRRGGRVVFADIESPTGPWIEPAGVRSLTTPRTRAVMAVHYAGIQAEIPALREAIPFGCAIIEDAAHFAGTDWPVEGDVSCFSFYGNKNLVTGEGGLVLTHDPAEADRVRSLRSHGMTRSSLDAAQARAADYDIAQVGTNARPTEIQAALGRVQLRKLAAHNQRRRELYEAYVDRLRDDVQLPERPTRSVIHLMLVLVDDRARVRNRLAEHGIQTSVHYPALHTLTAFRSIPTGPLPMSEEYAARTLTLPLHPRMTEDDVDFICGKLKEALRG